MTRGSLTSATLALLRRDLALAWRNRGQMLNPLLFALMVTALFPLGLGPEQELLRRVSAGLIWVIVLLALLMTLDALFRSDAEDGALDALLTSPHPLAVLVAARIFGHWLVTGLPLSLSAPLLALLLNLPPQALSVLLVSLLLGTLLLSLIGAICVALTVGMRRSGMLLALLALPLYMPALIFGSGAVDAAVHGLSARGPLLMLAAGVVFGAVVAPLATAFALRLGQN